MVNQVSTQNVVKKVVEELFDVLKKYNPSLPNVDYMLSKAQEDYKKELIP